LLSKAPRQSLSSGRRIRQSIEFELAFRANRLSNKWFVVYVRKNNSGISRLGMVVSKKTMPKAVTRNFAKRLVREVFRRDFPAGLSLDVVIRARRQIKPENSAEGRQALAHLLQAMRT
jgi:ribonuclease P protein component